MRDNANLMGFIAGGIILLIPIIFITYGFCQARKEQKKRETYKKRRERFKVIK